MISSDIQHNYNYRDNVKGILNAGMYMNMPNMQVALKDGLSLSFKDWFANIIQAGELTLNKLTDFDRFVFESPKLRIPR